MRFQTVFERYELKYLITREQKQMLLSVMEPHMRPDRYGYSVVRNLYLDTDTYRLIRRSNEKPVYKEKLRIRSYTSVAPGDTVFVELKKKYQSVVYKRRMSMRESEAMAWLAGGRCPEPASQIAREIEYFRNYYGNLHPSVYLSYGREAFYARDGSDFRVTFDEAVLARCNRLSLCEEPGGASILDGENLLMEIKTSAAIPLWMVHALTEQRIFKTSFSKYGTAYCRFICNHNKGELQYVC